jgi:hypothetical protein
LAARAIVAEAFPRYIDFIQQLRPKASLIAGPKTADARDGTIGGLLNLLRVVGKRLQAQQCIMIGARVDVRQPQPFGIWIEFIVHALLSPRLKLCGGALAGGSRP